MKRQLVSCALLFLSSLAAACSAGTKNAIFAAVQSDNTQQVARLLAEGTDVNVRNEDGSAPLHWAAYYGYREVADQLIRAGADINAKTTIGVTPLHVAARLKQKALAELLIAKGAIINAKWNDSVTPLHEAAIVGSFEIAELLISKGADIHAKAGEGVTPLYAAAKAGRVEVAELLIARGAEVDARTKSGYTPLIWIACEGNRDFAKLLIAHGADVNAKDAKGNTPLIWAIRSHYLASSIRNMSQVDATRRLELLKEFQKQFNLSDAAYQELQKEMQNAKGQWLDVTKMLIDHGADIGADFKKEDSLLYLAANLGSKDLVERLIDLGADINDARVGETALHGAIAEKHRDVAELLINKGARVTIKNKSGRTPLHFLAFYIDDQKLAESLINHGADINASDTNGETPLTSATRAGNNQVAKFLRERGGK